MRFILGFLLSLAMKIECIIRVSQYLSEISDNYQFFKDVKRVVLIPYCPVTHSKNCRLITSRGKVQIFHFLIDCQNLRGKFIVFGSNC